MRIFLTGATGFLGTVLLRDLLLKGHTVTAQGTLRRTDSFRRAVLSLSLEARNETEMEDLYREEENRGTVEAA